MVRNTMVGLLLNHSAHSDAGEATLHDRTIMTLKNLKWLSYTKNLPEDVDANSVKIKYND